MRGLFGCLGNIIIIVLVFGLIAMCSPVQRVTTRTSVKVKEEPGLVRQNRSESSFNEREEVILLKGATKKDPLCNQEQPPGVICGIEGDTLIRVCSTAPQAVASSELCVAPNTNRVTRDIKLTPKQVKERIKEGRYIYFYDLSIGQQLSIFRTLRQEPNYNLKEFPPDPYIPDTFTK